MILATSRRTEKWKEDILINDRDGHTEETEAAGSVAHLLYRIPFYAERDFEVSWETCW